MGQKAKFEVRGHCPVDGINKFFTPMTGQKLYVDMSLPFVLTVDGDVTGKMIDVILKELAAGFEEIGWKQCTVKYLGTEEITDGPADINSDSDLG